MNEVELVSKVKVKENLVKGNSDLELKLVFSRKQFGDLKPKFI